jgi:hypothetical protein
MSIKRLLRVLLVLKKYLSNVSRILSGYRFTSSRALGAISIASKESMKQELLGVSVRLLRSRRLKVIII